MNTITAAPPLGGLAGAQTLRKRQSSLCGPTRAQASSLRCGCGQAAPKVLAGRTPVQGATGCGARQRIGPAALAA